MTKNGKASELRVVLDTNVYLSAFLTKGTVRECLQRAVSHPRVSIGSSPATVHPRQRVHALTSIDESDNRILEAAEAFHANCIVSGDKHLLNLKEYKTIPILTPRQFLDTTVHLPNTQA